MDPYEESILRALRDGRTRDFHQLLEDVGFSHNTLRLHLDYLVQRGLITREKIPMEGMGRPKFTYSMSGGPERGTPGILRGPSDVVALPFRTLRRLCRFQRGGRCRETGDHCEAKICPQIQKSE